MRERLDIIQAWRAFAALAVVISHSVEAVARAYPEGSVCEALIALGMLGGFGVDVFFVISGFIMIYVHHDDFNRPGASQQFMSSRLRRIVPNYWFLTSLGVVVLLVLPSLSHHGRTFDLHWIIASYLFVPWTSDAGIPLPVLGLGWTLNYEMYFYLLFSIALLFPKRAGLILMIVMIVASIVIGTIFAPQIPLFKQMTSWLMAEFLLGVALGIAFKNGLTIPTSVAVALLAVAPPVLLISLGYREGGALPSFLRFIFLGLPAASLIAASLLAPRIRKLHVPSAIVLLGNASYALYLTHVFTLPVMVGLLAIFGIPLPYFVYLPVLVLASCGVAIAFFRLFETPVQAVLRPPRPARSA